MKPSTLLIYLATITITFAAVVAGVPASVSGDVPCFPPEMTMTISRGVFGSSQVWGFGAVTYHLDYDNNRGREDVLSHSGPGKSPYSTPYSVLFVSEPKHVAYVFNSTNCLAAEPANITKWCLDEYTKSEHSITVGQTKQDVWVFEKEIVKNVFMLDPKASFTLPTIRYVYENGIPITTDVWTDMKPSVDASVFEIPKQCEGKLSSYSDYAAFDLGFVM